MFAPEDLAIVKGDPSERRRYLDDLLVASRPRYAAVRADYERVVKQRSALLKSARAAGRGEPAGLDIWDEQLVTHGTALTAGRLQLTASLRPLVADRYNDVSGDARRVDQLPAGSERSGVFDPDRARQDRTDHARLARTPAPGRARRGVCLVGPHGRA
jgi:DNA replication and repair protein RecF